MTRPHGQGLVAELARDKLNVAFGGDDELMYEGQVVGWLVAGEPHDDPNDARDDPHKMKKSVWITEEEGRLCIVLRLFGGGVGSWEEMGFGDTSYFECVEPEHVELAIAQARFHAARLIEGYKMPTRPRRENPLRGRLQNHTPEWYAKLRRIREDRLARGGEPAYDPAYAARDAAASHRLSNPDYAAGPRIRSALARDGWHRLEESDFTHPDGGPAERMWDDIKLTLRDDDPSPEERRSLVADAAEFMRGFWEDYMPEGLDAATEIILVEQDDDMIGYHASVWFR